ncbi:MAG TPA: bifunctional diguanylate cyclase/phosphodiesterase [Solirubrobacteraceae bacterium]|nr:bifunctional diguanylate cyclase/phosphodiesterase [Solirubrobacteraceae bacterium]
MPDNQDASSAPPPGPEQQQPVATTGESAAQVPGPGEVTGAEDAPRREVPSARWLLAFVVVLAGIVISVLGARAIARSDAEGARRSFAHSADGVAAAVKLAIAHQGGLATAAGTYLSRNPEGSTAEFAAWAKWSRALRNHPELEALGAIALVRAPEAIAFHDQLAGRRSKASSSAKKGVTGTTPAGSSTAASTAASTSTAFSCLTIGQTGRTPVAETAFGSDLCRVHRALIATRDSAHTLYVPASLDGKPALEELTPAYRGSTTPKSLQGRRAAFVGWVREVIVPQVMLGEALKGLPAGAATLGHRSSTADAVFATGTEPARPQVSSVPLHGGWTLTTFAPQPSEAVGDDGDAIAFLIAALIASALAGVLVAWRGRRPVVAAAPEVAPVPEQRLPEDLYDALTGLPNRGLTLDRAERMLARAGRNSAIMVGALFIDIDWFKDVNDKLGDEAGDQLLKIVAERLEGVVRTHDTVGRYGGDEFVVIVESQVRGMRLDSLARRIIESLHKPVDIEGFGPSFCLTASIGVAFGRYATPDDLLRDAHMALFAAKAAGKDRYTLFNANMRSIIEGRGVLEVELNTALQEGQFSLLYQPVYDLGAGRVVALEALLRWVHPTKGEVNPADFVPLAEESGLIVPIGRWILEEACTRAAAWNVAGHRVGVAVKVSAKQLERDGFATDVMRALQMSGLDPSLLALEIAETTVMDDRATATQRLETLKQLGVRIAIDDFGSGYAYRSDLQQMPIDFLKVDRSSLAASEDEDYRSWLLEAILVFGRDLKLTVVAKGVETAEQALALKAMGCTMAQGYFLGEPAPSDAVEQLFQAAPGGSGRVPSDPAVAAAVASDPGSDQPAEPPLAAPASAEPAAPAPAAAPVESAVPAPAAASAESAVPAPATAQAEPLPAPATAAAVAAASGPSASVRPNGAVPSADASPEAPSPAGPALAGGEDPRAE